MNFGGIPSAGQYSYKTTLSYTSIPLSSPFSILLTSRLFYGRFSTFASFSAGHNFDLHSFSMHSSHFLAVALLAVIPLVSAHGLIASVTGNLGGKGSGFGVAAGGDQNLGDVTVFRASAGAFGATGAVSSLVRYLWPVGVILMSFPGRQHSSRHGPRGDDQDHRRHHTIS